MDMPLNDYQFPLRLTTPKLIIVLLDATMTNPNGDPENGGRPRTFDFDLGFITNNAIKRKFRDYLLLMKDKKHYIQPGGDLGEIQSEYTDARQAIASLRDLRYFGGVLTGLAAKVRGPFVVEDARSVHPINILDVAITRVAHHKKEGQDKKKANMGTRSVVQYGLYKSVIHFDPMAAAQVGLTAEDMNLFWEALFECWEHTRSANRPALNLRRVYCFDYPQRRGGVPQHVIQSWIKIDAENPTSFDDCTITVDTSQMPEGMSLHSWVDGVTSIEVR